MAPRAASTSSTSTSATRSAPLERVGRPVAEKRSSPKNAEKMSVRLPKSKWPGWNPPLRSPAWPKRS